MKPYQILFFLFSVFLLLFLLVLVFPENGFRVTADLRIRFSNLDDILKPDTVYYANIQDIIEEYRGVDSFDIQSEPVIIPEDGFSDSLMRDSLSLKVPKCLIEIPGSNPGVLFPIFNDLYTLARRRKLIRIMHYGDSQIELDRMTSFIRNKLQLTFGGSGLGMLSPVPLIPGSASIKQTFSENWGRCIGFGNNGKDPEHRKYGVMFSYARPETPPQGSFPDRNSWIRFSPTSLGYATSRTFNTISLYMTNSLDTTFLSLMINDTAYDHKMLIPGESLYCLSWKLESTPKDIYMSLQGKGNPELYGISLDHSWGVAVDNIPLRGSSGLVFSKADTSFLQDMYKDMNVRMIILQFGGNIVPMNAPDYAFYENYFRRELNVIRRMLPDIPVIVIGPSDMSVKEGDKYISSPGLIKVRDAVRNASLGAGYAFWDMFEAMGGQNSMPSWVNADPPLAASDFVHFTNRGSKIIAEMFYSAFMLEFYQWLNSENKVARNQAGKQTNNLKR